MNAIIAGATGLTGTALLEEIVQEDRYETIYVIGRSAPKLLHEKIYFIPTDFKNLDEISFPKEVRHAYSCLGTTMKAAGSKEAFYEVDFTFITAFANWCFVHGVTHFQMISALGADSSSLFYYNQVKGFTEEAVSKIPFKAIHIFRPSLLSGDRNQFRFGEKAALIFAKSLEFMIPEKYKAIEAAQVANVMLHAAFTKEEGIKIYESDQIRHPLL